ncbi:hypothetical protein LUZ60_016854 [Juncus effusus]|nr:hypothetical protein LUZ60_016854 [Juncus effusus]
MDRWTGLIDAPLSSGGPPFKIAASLLLSPSKTLSVPDINAIFFRGDRVERTGDPVIEKLSNSENLLEIIISKLGGNRLINAWVVEPPTYNNNFAVYKEMVPGINSFGDPKEYIPIGFPASSCLVKIISNCLNQIQNRLCKNISKENIPSISPTFSVPKTVILGFSKGGTVINQLVSELAFFVPVSHTSSNQNYIFPVSYEDFLYSISEFHYIDVGLNCAGAYITDKNIFKNIVNYLLDKEKYISFFMHGTPRQWNDLNRPWIKKEKDKTVNLLQEEGFRSEGKLKVFERFYFGDERPSLCMHFEIIDVMDLT